MATAYDRILEYITKIQEPVTSKQISEALKIPRRTVNDNLFIMVGMGDAVKNKTKYSLAPPVDPMTIVNMQTILTWVREGTLPAEEIIKRIKEAYSIPDK